MPPTDPSSNTAAAGQEIVLRHGSQMANRMLQYLVARRLQATSPEHVITNCSIAEWNMVGPRAAPGHRAVPKIDEACFDIGLVERLLADGKLPRVMIRAVPCSLRALPSRAEAQDCFPTQPNSTVTLGSGDLAIHIRLGDIIVPGRHRDYGPLPIGFYSALLEKTGLNPVFIGQIGEDWYSNALRAAFPEAEFHCGDVIEDFEALRRARHIVPAVSTFSWMAAWLGAAETIHLPLSGLLNPRQCPKIDLLPTDDPRYRFYWFDPRPWHADAADRERLTTSGEARGFGRTHAAALRREAREISEPVTNAWRERFLARIAELVT
ncbi:MAG: hypothetical protein AAGJ74_05955 [Pseudomonadota bacterium]